MNKTSIIKNKTINISNQINININLIYTLMITIISTQNKTRN